MPHFAALPKHALQWLTVAMLMFLTYVLAGNLAGLERWSLSKLVHFPVYWGTLALAIALIGMVRRRRAEAAVALILASAFGAQLAPLFIKPPPPVPSAKTTGDITVMTFNVLRHNSRHLEVLSALQAASPDVLYLTELSPVWHTALTPLSAIYPHRVGQRSNLLLSKFPLEGARGVPVDFDTAKAAIQSSGGATPPLDEGLRSHWWTAEVLTATVLMDGRRVRMAGIHPPIPGNSTSIFIQRAVACVCRDELRRDASAHMKIMLGDFNTSPFSPTFRFILRHLHLQDSAAGQGYTPTWGPRLPDEPWLPWTGIPIDHILVSKDAHIVSRDVGPPLGSDHRWVRATIRF